MLYEVITEIPLKIDWVARVTAIAGISNEVIIIPLNNPASVPTKSAMKIKEGMRNNFV